MSKYLQFDENGLPVDSFSQPKEAADSIFKTHEVKQDNRHDARGAGSAKAAGLAQQFYRNTHKESGEPDWRGLMLQASSGIEKMKIKEAQAAYQEEQKWKAHLEAEAAMSNRIAAIKTMPNRNKAFYERLQREDGRVYWSTEVQKQMKNDRSAQGLNWHSKKWPRIF